MQHVVPRNGQRLLSVVADDFGASVEIDNRILSCLHMGLVSDISVIVNSSDAALAQSVLRLKDSGATSTGLHLCLFSGSSVPLFPVSENPGGRRLLSSDGSLRQPSILSFLLPWPNQALDAAETEMRAQIKRYLSTGLPLHFVNSHRNALMNPALFARAAVIAVEYRIPYLRVVSEAAVGFPLFSKRSAFLFVMRGNIARCIRTAREKGIRHADHFLGFAEGMRLSTRQFNNMLSHLRPGITELVVHPGDDDHLFLDFSSPGEVDALFASRGIQRFPLCMAEGLD
jgi:predicted glycoside hydrolase/deacetylase ChbG (UPF0249 family)